MYHRWYKLIFQENRNLFIFIGTDRESIIFCCRPMEQNEKKENSAGVNGSTAQFLSVFLHLESLILILFISILRNSCFDFPWLIETMRRVIGKRHRGADEISLTNKKKR